MKVSIEDAVNLLMQGKIVAIPTETVYGLAAIATDPRAIAKIFEIKNRPADNPLICHFHSIEQIEAFVKDISKNTRKLIKHFSPGPLSFMIDLPVNSPLLFATCGRPQMIARIPDHPVFISIIQKINTPIAAPSANTSGKISPTSAEMVEQDLGQKIAGIVDGGLSVIGLESTIVDARLEDKISILRSGFIGEKEIKEVLPDVNIFLISSMSNSVIVPGSKYPHYAPDTPIYWLDDLSKIFSLSNVALIHTEEQLRAFSATEKESFFFNNIKLINLGSASDLAAVARHFYQHLSSVDQLQVSKAFILKYEWGNSSLGRAIESRLDKIVLGVYQ